MLVPLAIGEGRADAMGHPAQDVEGRRRSLGVEVVARPGRQLAIGIAILRRHELLQVQKFLIVVDFNFLEVDIFIEFKSFFYTKVYVEWSVHYLAYS